MPNFESTSYTNALFYFFLLQACLSSKLFKVAKLCISCFMANSRRPQSSIESIKVFNSDNVDDGSWIPCTLSIGSWVMMQTKKRKSSNTANEYLDLYKGHVKDFKFCPTINRMKEVLIEHAFHHRELRVRNLPSQLPLHRPNCRFAQSPFVVFDVFAHQVTCASF